MSDTMKRVEDQLVNRAQAIQEESTGSAVFAWGPIITLLLPILMEMLMNCFDSKSKEALEQKLINPSWWDRFWIERFTRRAAREKRDELQLSVRDRSKMAGILSEAIMTEAAEDHTLVSTLLEETDDNNIPEYGGWF
jgi:hypothetical protein